MSRENNLVTECQESTRGISFWGYEFFAFLLHTLRTLKKRINFWRKAFLAVISHQTLARSKFDAKLTALREGM